MVSAADVVDSRFAGITEHDGGGYYQEPRCTEAEKQAIRRKTKRRWRRWRRGGGAQLQLRTVRFQTVHVLW